jgi:hypothetical protein
VTISVNGILSNKGAIYGDNITSTTTGDLDNSGGAVIASRGKLAITANNIGNSTLLSQGETSLTATGTSPTAAATSKQSAMQTLPPPTSTTLIPTSPTAWCSQIAPQDSAAEPTSRQTAARPPRSCRKSTPPRDQATFAQTANTSAAQSWGTTSKLTVAATSPTVGPLQGGKLSASAPRTSIT